MKLALVLALLAVFWQWQASADYTDRDDVKAYIEELVSEHGFDRDDVTAVLAQAERKQSILDAISRPAERAKRWDEYRKIFVTDTRTAQGVEFWQENADAIAEASERYGVSPEIIVAIIGVETRYGRNTGSFRVVDALATLGFDYPKRSTFFRKELTQFLLLAREEQKDPLSLKGSYAGAMGYGQFIPSSFRAYAVDFDGDGIRDIWDNKRDAIGSVANYFDEHGWRGDAPVMLYATLARPDADELANQGLDLKHTLVSLEDAGVQIEGIPDGTPADTRAALFRLVLEDGEKYFVGLHDFYVITRYNRSHMYSLAVHQLSQVIKEAREAALAATATAGNAPKQ
ncbi:MAG: lytic murein transglycosylase B [Pseudomonadaceae bacterium]|nr:lytic murein transglycosylase B [Pseudomonadaceae bacterium]